MAMAKAAAAARSAASSLSSRVTPLRHTRTLFTDLLLADREPRSDEACPQAKLGMVRVGLHQAFVVERFQKYHKTLSSPGRHFLIPFIDRVARVHLVQWPHHIRDDLHLTPADLSLVVSFAYNLVFQVVDPKLASYNVKDPELATQQFVRDKLISEILSIYNPVDRLLKDHNRCLLCENAMKAANAETIHWGVKCTCLRLRSPSIAPQVTLDAMREIKLTQALKVV